MGVDQYELHRTGAAYRKGVKHLAYPGVFPEPHSIEGVVKAARCCFFGMPLWTMEELMTGYALSLFSLSAIDSDQSPVSSLTDLRLLQATPPARLRQVSRISRGTPPAP